RPTRRRSRRRQPRRTTTPPRPRPHRTATLDLQPQPDPPPRRQPVLHRPRRPRPHPPRRAVAAVAAGGGLWPQWGVHHAQRPGAGPRLPTRVRPDGYGLWAEHGRTVPLFLEYDTGGEPLDMLTAKLDGYHALFTNLGRIWPVLFWLHSTARER